ncbi:MAG: TolC family protein, partial [Gemmatimonadota bacterium]|nr:TolC family protein [Gemmatimonadota bacterium]
MLYQISPSLAVFATLLALAQSLRAQDTTSLALPRARALARTASPELAAARHSVDAARGRARQAGAFMNPVLSYDREQTGEGGESTSQEIIAIDQTIEAPGLRTARRDAARLRVTLAEARLRGAEAQLDLDVTRAFAHAVAARRRAELADQAARAFATAAGVS